MKGPFHFHNFFNPCWTQILLTYTLMLMVSMPIVRRGLKGDITKLEVVF